jgi:hypothetical protein
MKKIITPSIRVFIDATVWSLVGGIFLGILFKEICENQEDAKKVEESVEIIKDFFLSGW